MVYTTTDDAEEAARLARGLLDGRLAACVQIGRVASHYVWNGTPTQVEEYVLAIKTSSSRYEEVAAFIAAEHHYELPEVIEVPITRGSSGYLDWIDSATGLPGQ